MRMRCTCVCDHVLIIIAVVACCVQLGVSTCVTLVTGVGSTTRLYYKQSNKLWYRGELSNNGTRTGEYAYIETIVS